VRRPVLRNACADQTVEPQRRGPHQVGAHIVIFRLPERFGPLLDQREQQPFGKPVLNLAVHGIRQVLLQDVNKCIHHAVAGFGRRQRERFRRIQNGKTGKQKVVHDGALPVCGPARNNGPVVHFRTARRQCQNRAQRHCPADGGAFVFHEQIRLAAEGNGSGHKLGSVNHGTASDGEKEIDLFFAGQSNAGAKRFIFRIRPDAAKFGNVKACQRPENFIQDAVFPGALSAKGHHQPGIPWNLTGDLRYRIPAENHLRGILKSKIEHIHLHRIKETPLTNTRNQ